MDGKGGKKESVVKGFVASLSKTEGGRAGGKDTAAGGGGGDWHCPNCKIVVFASKTQCFLCRTPKTDFTAARLSAAALEAAKSEAAKAAGKAKTRDVEQPSAAVTATRSSVKNPRTILNEFVQKHKLPKLSVTSRPERPRPAADAPSPHVPDEGESDTPWWENFKEDFGAGEQDTVAGFRGKVVQHASDKDGKATVRLTKQLYPTADEAQQAAAVLGLFLVAGDRRMDRVLPADFVQLWRETEEDEVSRKKKEAQRELWRQVHTRACMHTCLLVSMCMYLPRGRYIERSVCRYIHTRTRTCT